MKNVTPSVSWRNFGIVMFLLGIAGTAVVFLFIIYNLFSFMCSYHLQFPLLAGRCGLAYLSLSANRSGRCDGGFFRQSVTH